MAFMATMSTKLCFAELGRRISPISTLHVRLPTRLYRRVPGLISACENSLKQPSSLNDSNPGGTDTITEHSEGQMVDDDGNDFPSAWSGPLAEPHVLYVVSTPIGNLADISPRALGILRSVDVIAAEDTRRTRILLQRAIPALNSNESTLLSRKLISCHAHNWKSRAPDLIARLQSGESVALVSDAGTPCVSDPGAEIAAAAIAAGIRVVPVPGPCAALAALVCAALPSGVPFVVLGFVPRSGSARTNALDKIATNYKDAAVVLYEAPHRLIETLADLAKLEKPRYAFDATVVRSVCLGREVTKKHEEFLRFESAANAAKYYLSSDTLANDTCAARSPRGEYTIVMGPVLATRIGQDENGEHPDKANLENTTCDIRKLVQELVEAGVPTNVIAKSVSASSTVSKKIIYAYVTELRRRLETGGVS